MVERKIYIRVEAKIDAFVNGLCSPNCSFLHILPKIKHATCKAYPDKEDPFPDVNGVELQIAPHGRYMRCKECRANGSKAIRQDVFVSEKL